MYTLHMIVSKEDYLSFFACLTLGTLTAVKQGVLSPDIGIWGFGRPKMRHALEQLGEIPPELLSVLDNADELSLLQQISPEKFDQKIENLMEGVKNVIATSKNPIWSVDLKVLES